MIRVNLTEPPCGTFGSAGSHLGEHRGRCSLSVFWSCVMRDLPDRRSERCER